MQEEQKKDYAIYRMALRLEQLKLVKQRMDWVQILVKWLCIVTIILLVPMYFNLLGAVKDFIIDFLEYILALYAGIALLLLRHYKRRELIDLECEKIKTHMLELSKNREIAERTYLQHRTPFYLLLLCSKLEAHINVMKDETNHWFLSELPLKRYPIRIILSYAIWTVLLLNAVLLYSVFGPN